MAINVNLTFSIPTSAELTDFCIQHGYTANIPDINNEGQTIPNPETKAAFAKRIVINFFRDSIRAKRASDAAEASRNAKILEVDALEIS